MAHDGEIPPGTAIEFDYITPLTDQICQEHIARSLASGLPDAHQRKRITVLANGPSAKDAPLHGDTIALNGAIRLFFNTGRVPTYWAACDPQAIVADFLDLPLSDRTTYFVASKCHPSVFERLEGFDVRLWHIRDQETPGRLRTPLGSSVTLSVFWLLTRLGYTDFDVWGWDGCYLDGEHHAGEAAPNYASDPNFVRLNYGGDWRISNVHADWSVEAELIGGQTFDTTRTWAAEARGAEQFFQLAEYLDLSINIHGDGMIKTVRRSILGD